jgi:hypothetical protein
MVILKLTLGGIMATLYFKIYPQSQDLHLIDGTEFPGTKNCHVEDDFLSEIHDVIGEQKVVIYGDESGTDEVGYPCIAGDAITQVKLKAEKFIDELIIAAADLIAKEEDRAEHYSKIMHMTELRHLLNLKLEYSLYNDFAILQLEP